jgi:hypothetical protein
MRIGDVQKLYFCNGLIPNGFDAAQLTNKFDVCFAVMKRGSSTIFYHCVLLGLVAQVQWWSAFMAEY